MHLTTVIHKIASFLLLSTLPLIAKDQDTKLLVGEASVTTNYVYRGISNSDNKPAIQGGVTLNDIWAQTGVYLNVWGSSVHFPDAVGKTTYAEIDTTVGVTNTIGKNFTYDVHALRYNYINAKGVSYNEGNASIQYYFLTAQLGYSTNVYASGKDGTYVNVGFKYDVPEDLIELTGIVVSGGIGHYSLPKSVGFRSYMDYNLQVSKTFELSKALSLLAALQWTNTNRKSIDPARLKRNHVIGTLTLNF